MAKGRLQAPRGAADVLPGEAARRRELGRLCEEVLGRAGYGQLETPVFEDTGLFARGVGEYTDIVQKEMFTFEDQGGRSLTLRPEGTAGICRAYIEHGMHKLPQPVRLWYMGPFFRHEAPQAGRYRQFAQAGAEALGSDDPSLDAELILLLAQLLEQAGARATRLRLGSLGSAETRNAYLDELRGFLRARANQLSDEVRARIESNPLRAFDADHAGTRTAMAEAPKLLDRLEAEDAEHLAEVRALLDDAGLEYELDPSLVRGLDYYTRTVFEFESDDLGAQRGLGGGGRYDRLVEQLGGPPTPAVGWAAGIERILLASDVQPRESLRPVFVALADAAGAREGLRLVRSLRAAGLSAEMEQAGRSLKGQLKHADRMDARAVVILGGEGIEVKDMDSGDQVRVADAAQVVQSLLAGDAPK